MLWNAKPSTNHTTSIGIAMTVPGGRPEGRVIRSSGRSGHSEELGERGQPDPGNLAAQQG